MGSLLREVAEQQTLLDAWHRIHADAHTDGTQRAAAERFTPGAARRIADISDALNDKTWRPGTVTPTTIPKPGGQTRTLALSTIPDKIVERAVLSTVDPIVDPELLPWSYAYRRGLGVSDALRTINQARDDGHHWIARIDIKDCFASIPRKPCLTLLAAIIDDPDLTEVVRLLVYRPHRGTRTSSAHGLHQGSPLSPLLCNLYLDQFDRHLLARGYRVIRYADDIAIPTTSRADGQRAISAADDALATLHMQRNDRKDQLAHVDTGIDFLGATITADSTTGAEPASHPQRSSLYVVQQGALLRTKGPRIRVEHRDTTLLSIGWQRVDHVVCFGRVGLTTPFLQRALQHGTGISLLSSNGRYDGRLSSPFTAGAAARHKQHLLAADPTAALAIAGAIVAGKIANMRVALLRASRRGRVEHLAAQIDHLREQRRHALHAESHLTLLGIEGAATRRYFHAWGDQLTKPWVFHSRRRRPPPDPINAMLSFGYSLLTYEVLAAIESTGLDPAIGFLHQSKGNRPSLALDLLEEFRPVIVDSTITRITATGMLTPDDFTTEDLDDDRRRCLLTDTGRRVFLGAYERRMLTLVTHPTAGRRISYRVSIHEQARHLARVFTGHEHRYRPLAWK